MSARKPYDHPDCVAARAERERDERLRRFGVAFLDLLPEEQRRAADWVLDQVRAGPPRPALTTVAEDAAWWVGVAPLYEVTAYMFATVARVTNAHPRELARELLVIAWPALPEEDRAAFLAGQSRRARE